MLGNCRARIARDTGIEKRYKVQFHWLLFLAFRGWIMELGVVLRVEKCRTKRGSVARKGQGREKRQILITLSLEKNISEWPTNH